MSEYIFLTERISLLKKTLNLNKVHILFTLQSLLLSSSIRPTAYCAPCPWYNHRQRDIVEGNCVCVFATYLDRASQTRPLYYCPKRLGSADTPSHNYDSILQKNKSMSPRVKREPRTLQSVKLFDQNKSQVAESVSSAVFPNRWIRSHIIVVIIMFLSNFINGGFKPNSFFKSENYKTCRLLRNIMKQGRLNS